jgi:hypothetical protein
LEERFNRTVFLYLVEIFVSFLNSGFERSIAKFQANSVESVVNQQCSGQEMPDSEGHRSEALNNLGSGNLEGGGIGERVVKGRSVYKQPETKVDGSCDS